MKTISSERQAMALWTTQGDASMQLPAGARVALRVGYRGHGFAGWQRQPNAPTVQQELEESLERLLCSPVRVVGAGRTDRGVHAEGQVVHLALPREFPLRGLVLGSNSLLPESIRVLGAARVEASFHAQRSALWKLYRYRLALTQTTAPHESQSVGSFEGLGPRIDVDKMAAAAPLLVGRHDFSAFAKAGGAHSSAVRTLFEIELDRIGDPPRQIELRVRGDGFLRGMVRALVGSLVEVGVDRRREGWLAELLAGGERAQAGVAAPARGLSMLAVSYPPELFLGPVYSADR